jgi:hypothetical protein
MEESLAIIQRIFTCAAMKIGSAAHLADHLGIGHGDIGLYLRGQTMPTDLVLLKVVDLLIEEMPAIRSEFSEAAWKALGRPGDSVRR